MTTTTSLIVRGRARRDDAATRVQLRAREGVTFASVLSLLIICGCRCDDINKRESVLNEAGTFRKYPVRYEIHVEGNAATVTVNGSAELIICDTFSENRRAQDLPTPLPRLRQHGSSAELTPYLRGGSNEVGIKVRPDGDDDAPVSYKFVRIEDGRRSKTLAEGEVPVESAEGVVFSVEIPNGCDPPRLPSHDWIRSFLAPYPKAARTQDADAFEDFLIPARTSDEASVRKKGFDLFRTFSFNDSPMPPDAVRQTHESIPLTTNYSCENERLFVFPEDGGHLFAAVQIERHLEGPLPGVAVESILVPAVALGYWNGKWYLAEQI